MSPFAVHRARWASALVLSAGLAGCSFDLEKLYSESATAEVPGNLYELFRDSYALSDECASCAADRCSDVNETCRADATCTAFTACIAERNTPAQRELCRAQYASWVGESSALLDRDVNGPYGMCVLSQYCADVCGTHDDLSCLDQYTWPMGKTNVTYRLRLTDTDYSVLPGVSVRVCKPENTDVCTGTETFVSDSAGIVDVPLQLSASGGFVGYLEISEKGLAKQLLRFGWPISEGAAMNVPVIDNNVLGGVLAYAQRPPARQTVDLQTRGMVQVRVTGCSGIPLSGAKIAVKGFDDDPTLATWYAAGDSDIAPSFSATATNDLGAGGIVNIPPGRIALETGMEATGQMVSEMTVPVRAGYITTVLVVPTNSN